MMDRIIKEIKDVEDKVRNILRNDELARENDEWLMFKIWSEQAGMNTPSFRLINNLCKASTISRCRRKIQNEERLYPPKNPIVARRRKVKEETYKTYYGYDDGLMANYKLVTYEVGDRK